MVMISEKMISPSEQVDHVWHLHQLFTRQYRIDSHHLLFRFLRHLPAMGGKEDGEKFNNIYDETLDFYKCLFG